MSRSNHLLSDGQAQSENPSNVRWMIVTLVILVSMAYLTMFLDAFLGEPPADFTILDIFLLVILGVLYTFLVIYPNWVMDWVPEPFSILAYLVVVFGIAFWISWLSQLEGQVWLLILPPLGTAAEKGIRWLFVASLMALTVTPMAIYLIIGEPEFASLFTLIPAVFFVAAFSLVSVRERNARFQIEELVRELQTANQKLSDYAAKVEELVVVRERNHMAREIHDSLGHYLTVVNVQIRAARAVLDKNPEKAAEALDHAQRLTQDGLTDVRKSVALLREGSESRPLLEAIPELVRQSEAAGIKTTFETAGHFPADLTPKISQTIYRTIQEGLTNIRKHSGATSSEIVLDASSPESLHLTIRDNGQGAATIEGGFGLMGMRERIELSGGKLAIETKPNSGFILRAEIPMINNYE